MARRHNADKPVEKNSSGILKLTKKKPTVSMSVGRIRRVGTANVPPGLSSRCHRSEILGCQVCEASSSGAREER